MTISARRRHGWSGPISAVPVIPGTDVLVIHGPQFPSITMHLATGNALTIHGDGAGHGSRTSRA